MNRKSINLTQKQIENRALIVTTVVNAIITGAGIWMYFLTDLQMMFLDGFFSLIGLLSALAAVLISKVSKRMGKAALNEQGCNSREVVLTAARLKPTFCNLTF